MLKFLLTFSAGVYTGIYLSQNYEIPKVDDPNKMIEKIKEIADDHRKKTPAEQIVHNIKKESGKINN